MRLPPAPKLRTCIIAYYAALFLFGIVGTLLAPGTAAYDLGAAIRDSLWILFVAHFFFVSAVVLAHDWRSFLMVVGISTAIIVAATKLTHWRRNLTVLGLLFMAHVCSIALAGMS